LQAGNFAVSKKMSNFAVEKRGQIWLLATTQKNAKIAGAHRCPAVMSDAQSASTLTRHSTATLVNVFRNKRGFFVRHDLDINN